MTDVLKKEAMKIQTERQQILCSEETACGEASGRPRRDVSEETNPAGAVILDLQPPELRERNVCSFSHPVCGP